MTCEDARDLIAQWALGEIEPADRALVELHLAGCAECRIALVEYRDTIDRLPLALAQRSAEPLPAEIKDRLFRSINQGREPLEKRSTFNVQPSTATKRSAFRWAALVAAAVLVAVVVGWNVQLSAALAQERALRSEYASLVEQQEIVLEVVDSPRTVRRLLRSSTGGTAYGKVFTRPDLPEVVVMAARLETPPAGQAYHLWLTSDGQTRLAGTLNVNTAGFGLIVFESGRTGPTYQSARVTLQPEGSEPAGTLTLAWDGSQ